jgi:hypothetical protein
MAMSKLKSLTVDVSRLSHAQQNVMFELFARYYENVIAEKFYSDLAQKDKVILLLDSSKIIRGFSTLKFLELEMNKKKIIGIFSGDTVMDSSFWGGTALTMEFFKNVMGVKLKNPWTNVYWFLISKGFKTYLLLANNFAWYYPRFDRSLSNEAKSIIDTFATKLFGNLYDTKTLILKAASLYDRLKDNVAPITDQMQKTNPKIAYFNQMNPSWMQGDELCCIGRVDLGLVKVYLTRTFFKYVKRLLRRSKSPNQAYKKHN